MIVAACDSHVRFPGCYDPHRWLGIPGETLYRATHRFPAWLHRARLWRPVDGIRAAQAVQRRPHRVDEIEKASREFVTLFLQVLDDSGLTDGQGRVVDFRNTVIVMTSNLGAAYLNDMGEGRVRPHTRQLVMGAIQAHFPPESVNRIDEIIIFVSDIYYGRSEILMLVALSSADFLRRTPCAYRRLAP